MQELPDLDPADARPVNQQIADRLREGIESGVLAAGSRVPGENTLMARYGVARWTAREALASLAGGGLITKIPKVGTFVRGQRRLERRPRRYRRRKKAAGPFATDARIAGMDPDIEADSRVIQAPADVAERLGLEPAAEVMCTRYRFLADGKPVQASISYEPRAITGGTPVELPEEGPLAGVGVITRMDSIGVEITRVMEEVTIRPPRPAEVVSLDIPSGVHVFDILRTFAADERPVETANIVIPGDRYALVYAFRVTEDSDDPVTT